MNNEPKIIQIAILYNLIADFGNGNSTDYGCFSTEELAQKASQIIPGYPVIKKAEQQLPCKYYTDIKEWAKDYLTVNEYLKHFKEL